MNKLKEKYEQRESNYKERIETWAARASELKNRLQQLEGHGEDYGQINNVEQLKVKIKKLTSRLSKAEKERDDVLNTLNAQSHDFNNNHNISNNGINNSSNSNNNNINFGGGLAGLFRNISNNKIHDDIKKINRMYQTLTSISMAYQQDNDVFLCQGIDSKTNDILKFELSIGISEEDSNEMVMSYVPIQNVHSLPEHLQDEIEFNVVHAHNFFNTIFTHIK